MQELTQYVNNANKTRKLWGDPEYDLSQASDRIELQLSLECDLSPENLARDGERPRAEINRVRAFLSRVQEQLESLS